ncbi:MAG: YIP1 family protein [Myxococcota bacterium]
MEETRDDSLQQRMIRAARLDAALYDEVAVDPRALPQALAVVLLSSVATGISFGQGDLMLIAQGMAFALMGWWVTSYLAFFLGTRLLAEKRDAPPEKVRVTPSGEPAPGVFEPRPECLLRAIGFASAPGIVRLLGAIPDLAIEVMLVTTLWMVAAAVVAIRQALGFQSTGRALLVYAAIQVLMVPLLLLFLAGAVENPPVAAP